MQYSCIISHLLSSPEGGFCDIQIVIITNFVVLSNVGIKRVDYIWIPKTNLQTGQRFYCLYKQYENQKKEKKADVTLTLF